MSIQTDLTRIKNAKATIKAYIEGNGLTVPDATLLDGMASMLSSIEAGGDVPDFGHTISFGTYTTANNETGSSANIKTDLNRVYAAFIWCDQLFSDPAQSNDAIICGAMVADPTGWTYSGSTYKKLSCWNYKSTSGLLNGGSFKLTVNPNSNIVIYATRAFFIAGYTYKWIAWGEAKS